MYYIVRNAVVNLLHNKERQAVLDYNKGGRCPGRCMDNAGRGRSPGS